MYIRAVLLQQEFEHKVSEWFDLVGVNDASVFMCE